MRLGYSALPSTSHGRGTSRGPSAVENMCILGVLSGPLRLSVQVAALGRPAVFMVRRRSTVRFRKGLRKGSRPPGVWVRPGWAVGGPERNHDHRDHPGLYRHEHYRAGGRCRRDMARGMDAGPAAAAAPRTNPPVSSGNQARSWAAEDLSGPAWDVPLARGRHHRQAATAHRQDSLYGRHRANF